MHGFGAIFKKILVRYNRKSAWDASNKKVHKQGLLNKRKPKI